MTELEIPMALTETRRRSLQVDWPYATKITTHPFSRWVGFRPDVEEWITKNFKIKHRKAVKLYKRLRTEWRDVESGGRNMGEHQFKIVFHVVEFIDEKDAVLFKLFWL